MSDFQKSAGSDKSHLRHLPIHHTPKDNNTKEIFYSDEGGSKIKANALTPATFIIWFKKIITLFSNRLKNPQEKTDEAQLLEDLLAFRKMLQILSNEDQSHNPEYTQQLAELWHNLMDDCNPLEPLNRKKQAYLFHLKSFIEKIRIFPSSQEHSLGYYLTHCGGNEGLPFSLIDILHKLHQEHRENQEISHLNEWISLSDSIIFSLDLKIDSSNL